MFVRYVTMPSGHRPQPPVGTARVAISGLTSANNPWVAVYWLNITATTHTLADLSNVVDAMVEAFKTRMLPFISTSCDVTGYKATWLIGSGSALEYKATTTGVGTGGSTSSVDSACTLINWAISDYYRGGHPRTYLVGVPSAKIGSARTIDGTFCANLATAATAWIGDVNALTHGGISAVVLGTVRFASGNAWLSPPVFRAYTSASVNTVIATQRRRLATP